MGTVNLLASRRVVIASLLLAVLFAPAAAPAATLHPGDVVMIVKGYGVLNTIGWVHSGTGESGTLAQGPPISDPRDIAMRSDGTILIADAVSGLLAVDPASGVITTLVAASQFGSTGPTTLTLTSHGDVLVAGAWGVQRVPAGSTTPQVVSPTGQLIAPVGIGVDASGAIWVSDHYGNITDAIVRVDPATGAQSALPLVAIPCGLGQCFPVGLSFLRAGSDGMLYVMNQPGGVAGFSAAGIYQVNPASGVGTMWFGNPYPEGFQMNSDGSAIVLFANEYSHGPPEDGWLVHFNGATTTGLGSGFPWGPIAVVPAGVTPTIKASWGQIKTRYR